MHPTAYLVLPIGYKAITIITFITIKPLTYTPSKILQNTILVVCIWLESVKCIRGKSVFYYIQFVYAPFRSIRNSTSTTFAGKLLIPHPQHIQLYAIPTILYVYNAISNNISYRWLCRLQIIEF